MFFVFYSYIYTVDGIVMILEGGTNSIALIIFHFS